MSIKGARGSRDFGKHGRRAAAAECCGHALEPGAETGECWRSSAECALNLYLHTYICLHFAPSQSLLFALHRSTLSKQSGTNGNKLKLCSCCEIRQEGESESERRGGNHMGTTDLHSQQLNYMNLKSLIIKIISSVDHRQAEGGEGRMHTPGMRH